LKVHIRHVDGHTLVAKSDSNHWVPLDTSAAGGGTAAANDPFQLFVIGCGGCSFVDVVDILAKSRKNFTRIELFLEAARAETIPKILRKLMFHYHVDGSEMTVELIRRAIELSLTKYCSASLSLDRSIVFEALITLNGQAHESFAIARDASIFER
jgi:putative redox protein